MAEEHLVEGKIKVMKTEINAKEGQELIRGKDRGKNTLG